MEQQKSGPICSSCERMEPGKRYCVTRMNHHFKKSRWAARLKHWPDWKAPIWWKKPEINT